MSRIFLTDEDRQLVEEWRQGTYRVLDEVRPAKYRDPDGCIIQVPCSDGHQIIDICTFQSKLVKPGHEPMVHTLGLNGGPLLLAPGTPLLQVGEHDDDVLLKHIEQACQLKGTPTVVLYAHAPCGAAKMTGLSIAQVIELLLAAKKRVKQHLPGIQVIPKCHIDKAFNIGENHKHSYFVNRSAFEAWKASIAI